VSVSPSVSVSRKSVLHLGLVDSSAPSLWRFGPRCIRFSKAQSSLRQSAEASPSVSSCRNPGTPCAVSSTTSALALERSLVWLGSGCQGNSLGGLTELSSCLGTIGLLRWCRPTRQPFRSCGSLVVLLCWSWKCDQPLPSTLPRPLLIGHLVMLAIAVLPWAVTAFTALSDSSLPLLPQPSCVTFGSGANDQTTKQTVDVCSLPCPSFVLAFHPYLLPAYAAVQTHPQPHPQHSDAFALNIGPESWQWEQARSAYRVAERLMTAEDATGSVPSLFLSLDMNVLPCDTAADRDKLVALVVDLAASPAALRRMKKGDRRFQPKKRGRQARHQREGESKVMLSTFGGADARFGGKGWPGFVDEAERKGVEVSQAGRSTSSAGRQRAVQRKGDAHSTPVSDGVPAHSVGTAWARTAPMALVRTQRPQRHSTDKGSRCNIHRSDSER
jgi:hypothetical protein